MQISEHPLQAATYPPYLAEIHNPPAILYSLGQLPLAPCVAVVGTRNATSYGKAITYQVAGDLAAAGFIIVSGLATGIDAVAHRAALDAGGMTVAVLAGGLDSLYPASNRELAIELLAKGGAIISEHPAGSPPYKGSFVARNRIISGLSVATLITEAPDGSGAAHTINFAQLQNRPCYAVPGRATDVTSALCNDLIQKGEAQAVFSANPIINDFRHLLTPHAPEVTSALDPREAKVLALLQQGFSSNQDLITAGEFTAAELADILSLLELSGSVRNLGAGQWASRAGRPKVKLA